MEITRKKAHNRSPRNLGIFVLIYLLIAPVWAGGVSGRLGDDPARPQTEITSAIKRQFRRLKTNLLKHSIDLTLIYDGGPGKDGIPAICDP
jgi:hypothetical protein